MVLQHRWYDMGSRFWQSFTLTDGTYNNLQVKQVDTAGNSSVRNLPAITVDTTAPKLAILSAQDNTGSSQGSLYSGGSTDDTHPDFIWYLLILVQVLVLNCQMVR